MADKVIFHRSGCSSIAPSGTNAHGPLASSGVAFGINRHEGTQRWAERTAGFMARPSKGELTTPGRPALRFGALALGATALGVLCVGALSIGAASIGALHIGRTRIRKLRIDQLEVGRLIVTDAVEHREP